MLRLFKISLVLIALPIMVNDLSATFDSKYEPHLKTQKLNYSDAMGEYSSNHEESYTEMMDIDDEKIDLYAEENNSIKLLDLPDSILLRILQYFDDPLELGLVCKRLESLLSDRTVPLLMPFSSEEDFYLRIQEVLYIRSGIKLNFNFPIDPFNQLTKRTRELSYLDLSGSHIDDEKLALILPKLPYLRTLDLSYTEIKNVSVLRGIPELKLVHCDGIVDFSGLGGHRKLDLSLTMITDVSHLGSVETLVLTSTPVRNISALAKVRNLHLAASAVEDVSHIGAHEFLDLTGTSVNRVDTLGKVRILNLSNTRVVDVSNLTYVEQLNLTGTLVEDVSMLVNLKRLTFWGHRIPTESLKKLKQKNPYVEIDTKLFLMMN